MPERPLPEWFASEASRHSVRDRSIPSVRDGGDGTAAVASQIGEVEVLRHQGVHAPTLLGVGDLDPEMVDQVFRLLDPCAPAVGAHTCKHPRSAGTCKWCLIQAGGVALASAACDVGHLPEV